VVEFGHFGGASACHVLVRILGGKKLHWPLASIPAIRACTGGQNGGDYEPGRVFCFPEASNRYTGPIGCALGIDRAKCHVHEERKNASGGSDSQKA